MVTRGDDEGRLRWHSLPAPAVSLPAGSPAGPLRGELVVDDDGRGRGLLAGGGRSYQVASLDPAEDATRDPEKKEGDWRYGWNNNFGEGAYLYTLGCCSKKITAMGVGGCGLNGGRNGIIVH